MSKSLKHSAARVRRDLAAEMGIISVAHRDLSQPFDIDNPKLFVRQLDQIFTPHVLQRSLNVNFTEAIGFGKLTLRYAKVESEAARQPTALMR